MNAAHYLTVLRLILIPLFPLFYLQYEAFGISPIYLPYVLLGILLLCELTDVIDGLVARVKDQVTDLGKIMDPMADSITRVLVLFTFTQGWVSVPILLIFVFLYREFFITSLRTICAVGGYVLAARKSGKIKAVLQASVNIFIVLLMIPFTLGWMTLELLQKLSFYVILVAAIYSLLTTIDYVYANRIYLKKALKKKSHKV